MADQMSEKKPSGAESPTTAREPDFDDDQEHPHESSASAPIDRIETPVKEHKRVSFQEEEAPPTKPPRPADVRAQAEATLTEAFPAIDPKVVKAVLMASGGKVEQAFNALLSMSDPDFVAEQPPAQPPRPRARNEMTQLEADEQYARQLAEHYEGGMAGPGRGRGDAAAAQRRQEAYDDRDRSFFDDDLPVIKQNIQKGFQETQKTVNKWLTDFKKRLDGDEEDEEPIRQGQPSGQQPRQNFGSSQSEQLRGIRRSADQSRRSGERERYDADPRVLDDDFTQLDLHDGDAPRRPPRPQANPDLFKATPAVPSGPIDEVDALYRNPTPPQNRGPSPSAKSGKKWQPLTSLAPAPVADDNDPFSLGDSDEEETKKTDLKPEDSERLKKSASVSESGKGAALEPTESTGTKNKEAEELLKASEKK